MLHYINNELIFIFYNALYIFYKINYINVIIVSIPFYIEYFTKLSSVLFKQHFVTP